MPATCIRNNQIIEQWDALLTGACGKGELVMEETIRVLEASEAPDICIEWRALAPGIIQGLVGSRCPCLLVSNTTNSNLQPFNMYITARNYGRHLQVSWYLVYQLSFWNLVVNAILCIPILSLLVFPVYLIAKLAQSKESGILHLNLFDEQALKSYITNAHQCLLDAVEAVTHQQANEPSAQSEHSKGFLGIIA